MSPLSREGVFEACREIYKMAGDNFMLPPLIRNADSLDASSSHTYYCLTETSRVRFVVEFDKKFVDEHKFPLSRIPLRFNCELCDVDFKEPPVEFGENEKRELIRAFFLGAKAPIIAKKGPLTTGFKLHIQLSAAFFVECGEFSRDDGHVTSEAISNRVAMSLYDKSKDFFESAQDGLTVWRARAAQELFGEPKPSPEKLWPVASRALAVASSRRELAPTQAPAGVPSLAAVTALASAPTLSSPPIVASRSLMRSAGGALERRRQFFQSAVAALVLIAVASLIGRSSGGGPTSTPPESPTFVAQTSSPSVLAERAAPVESAFAPSSAIEAIQQSADPAQQSAPVTVAAVTRDGAGAISAPPRSAAPETASPRAINMKSMASRRRHRQPDPLVAVGRAANKLAAGVVKNLRRLPNNLSALISGR